MQPKSGLPTDGGVRASEQQRRPGPLLERLQEGSRVVQPFGGPHEVALRGQALERLVADSQQVRLLDSHQPVLRPNQLPELPREILSSLHALIIGSADVSASRQAAPVDKTLDPAASSSQPAQAVS